MMNKENKKIKYTEFKEKAKRSNASENDKVHFFSKNFSISTAFILYKFGFSPNAATALFGIIGILSAFSFWHGYYITGYILFRLHIIVDMADGSIARATKVFSKYADGYDKSIHIIVNSSVIFSLSKYSSDISFIVLLVVFLNYYLFNKLYSEYPKGLYSGQINIFKVLIKNFIGFEGYILITSIYLSISLSNVSFLNYIYISSFAILTFLKFRYMRIRIS